MPVRLRKFIGMILLLVFLTLYSLLVMVFAVNTVHTMSKVAQGIFYIVAGLAWVFPAGLLITWMQRVDKETAD